MLFVQTHRPLNLRKEKVEKQTWITTLAFYNYLAYYNFWIRMNQPSFN